MTSCRKSERNIADTKSRVQSEVICPHSYGLESLSRLILLCGNCKCKTVNYNIFFLQTVFKASFQYMTCIVYSLFCGSRKSALIQCKTYYGSTLFLYNRQYEVKSFILGIHRVYYRSAVVYTKSGFYCLTI